MREHIEADFREIHTRSVRVELATTTIRPPDWMATPRRTSLTSPTVVVTKPPPLNVVSEPKQGDLELTAGASGRLEAGRGALGEARRRGAEG